MPLEDFSLASSFLRMRKPSVLSFSKASARCSLGLPGSNGQMNVSVAPVLLMLCEEVWPRRSRFCSKEESTIKGVLNSQSQTYIFVTS